MKLRMKKDLQQSHPGGVPAPGRRGFLAGVGAAGLTAATAIFGFASPALATVKVGCCNLYCSPSNTLYQCEHCFTTYTWTCTVNGANGKPLETCYCCECGKPPLFGCNSSNWSTADCT